MDIGKINYLTCDTPLQYVCSKCGLIKVRLWRQYQTCADNIKLLCVKCACEDQNEDINNILQHRDTIGWLVPAVPTEEGDTYWGYTSVPQNDVNWWYNLPYR